MFPKTTISSPCCRPSVNTTTSRRLTKYKHNYDYQLTLLILNKKTYMSNESILLAENESPFSPISVLH